MANSPSTSYKSILKATSLLGSVRVFVIIVAVVKNKIIAVMLGPAGIGLLGIFTSTLTLINSICDLGITKSSVRNIAEANAGEDKRQVGKIYNIFIKLLYSLSIVGAVFTATFSRQLSIWSFGTDLYKWSFVALAFAVFFNSISFGQLAVLQGLRKFRFLAKASSIGAVVGLIVSIPLFYFFKEKGIVPSLILSGVTAFLLSTFYVNKLRIQHDAVSKQEMITHGMDMAKLGISMMLVSFMVAMSGYVLKAYLSNNAGIDTVGIFQAGFTIVSSYFGVVFTAMSTDFFPRISAVNKDNTQIEAEINRQSVILLLLLSPLVVCLLYLMPLFITGLYSSKFILAGEYVNTAILGIVFFAIGQLFSMILLAKNNAKVFILFTFLMQLCFLLNSLFFFKIGGIKGMGIAYSINMTVYALSILFIIYKLYSIKLSKQSYIIMGIVLAFTSFSVLLKDINPLWLRYSIAGILFVASSYYSINAFKKILEILSIWEFIKSKLKNKL